MDAESTFLKSLQGKIFKLLPMKEAFDDGEDNKIWEYLNNLCINLDGAFLCYPDLSTSAKIVEVKNNLRYLGSFAGVTADHEKWRDIILRSTRLVCEAEQCYRITGVLL